MFRSKTKADVGVKFDCVNSISLGAIQGTKAHSCVGLHNTEHDFGCVSGPWPCSPPLLPGHHELSNFGPPHPSAMMFLSWSQLTNQGLNSLNLWATLNFSFKLRVADTATAIGKLTKRDIVARAKKVTPEIMWHLQMAILGVSTKQKCTVHQQLTVYTQERIIPWLGAKHNMCDTDYLISLLPSYLSEICYINLINQNLHWVCVGINYSNTCQPKFYALCPLPFALCIRHIWISDGGTGVPTHRQWNNNQRSWPVCSACPTRIHTQAGLQSRMSFF